MNYELHSETGKIEEYDSDNFTETFAGMKEEIATWDHEALTLYDWSKATGDTGENYARVIEWDDEDGITWGWSAEYTNP